MSCENTNARLQIKYTTIAGQVPTIPSTNDHNDGTWNPTDIYIGEFFLNSQDDLLWVRTLDGILAVGGTGGSASFIGDFVSKANGGTYSGPVFAPTFSAINMIATTISATAIDATIFGSTGSTYYGDGSNLTGITTNWNGGTVSDPTQFDNTVDFNQDISVNNVYAGTLGYTHIHSDVTVDGGLSASYFIGDGSLITNLPLGPTANDYTTNAYLDGNIIRYDRTDLADAYSVDLTPILFTQSIVSFDWNSSTNDATITINDGSFFTINLGIFDNISTAIINASDIYASNFYGTFNGVFTDDIYTTSAVLEGSDAVFTRTDGITYSLDLSTFSGGSGATGPTGPQGYRAVMNLSYTGSGLTLGLGTITLPIGTPINNLGWQQGTRLRVWHSATEYMEGQITSTITNPQTTGINVNIDYVIGTGTFGQWYVGIAGDIGTGGSGGGSTQSLAQTLVLGNTTDNNDIILSNSTFAGTSDNIKAFGNTMADAKFSFEDYGGGAWAPTMRAQNGNSTNYITVGDSETYIHNSQADSFVDRYGQIEVGPTQITTSLNDLANGQGTAFVMTSTSILVGNQATTPNVFPGIQYDIDYSANFTNRSLVDKGYVDNAVSGAGSGITYSGSMDYTTFFDSNNSLSYTDTYYNSGRTTFGHYTGTPWIWDQAGKLNVYSPYSMQPAIIAEGGQFGGMFIASDNTAGGQLIGLQAYAGGSQVSGNLGLYSRADGTQSANIGGQFVAYNGVLYPGYSGAANTGVFIDVYSGGVDPSVAGLTNSGIQVSVSGRGGDKNYIGQFQDGSEGAGKVLTCIDSTGLATWQTPTGGGGTASATMFNSVIVPAPYGGALPWYKLNVPAITFGISSYVLATDQISYSTVNLVAGELINEVAIYCSTLLAGCTASIALYSGSLDANGYHYPSTLLTTFGAVSLATQGRKTITGLNYTIPSSPYGIYYTAILRSGPAGSPAIIGPLNSQSVVYYASLNATSQDRPMTARPPGAVTSFPATITSTAFSTYTSTTTLPYIGFR